MKKMKVCELVDTYYPVVDGVINVIKHYSEILSTEVDCKLGAPRPAKKDKYVDNEKFEVIRCNSVRAPENYRVAQPQSDRRFVRKMDSENFDIIHVHTPFTMGRYAIKAGKKIAVPVVATLHTQYHQDFERVSKGFKPFVKIALAYIMHVYKRADSVWTVSDKAGSFLRDYGYKGDIKVIRSGTDYVYPDNYQELIDRVNNLHNLHDKKNVFVFVGRMAWYKNIKMICDSLKILKDAGKEFTMLFVGGGFDLQQIKKYVNTIDLNDNCIFTGEVKDRETLQAYYLRGDLMLFPSTFDTASIVKTEAAAHKLACMVVRDSCCAEGVIDNENGFLCEENAESMAEKLLLLLDCPEKFKQAGEMAYKTVYRTWDDAKDEIISEYENIIKEYKEKMLAKNPDKYLKKRQRAENRAKILKEKLNKKK